MNNEQAEKFLAMSIQFMQDEGLPLPNKDMPAEEAFRFMRDFFRSVVTELEAKRSQAQQADNPNRIGDTFYIEFNTEDGPGIFATKVVICSEYLQDMNATLRIDLCDHPLYKKLEQYVKANPTWKRK